MLSFAFQCYHYYFGDYTNSKKSDRDYVIGLVKMNWHSLVSSLPTMSH